MYWTGKIRILPSVGGAWEPSRTADGSGNWGRNPAGGPGGNSRLGLCLLPDPASPHLGTHQEGILTEFVRVLHE